MVALGCLAIENVALERRLLAATAVEAPAHGLTVDMAENFIGSQLTASKMLQQTLFDEWKAAGLGPFPNAPDLTKVTGPKLEAMTPNLLAALRAALPDLKGTAVQQRLAQVPPDWGHVPEVWDAAIAPLMNFTVGEY